MVLILIQSANFRWPTSRFTTSIAFNSNRCAGSGTKALASRFARLVLPTPGAPEWMIIEREKWLFGPKLKERNSYLDQNWKREMVIWTKAEREKSPNIDFSLSALPIYCLKNLPKKWKAHTFTLLSDCRVQHKLLTVSSSIIISSVIVFVAWCRVVWAIEGRAKMGRATLSRVNLFPTE